MALYVQYEAIC